MFDTDQVDNAVLNIAKTPHDMLQAQSLSNSEIENLCVLLVVSVAQSVGKSEQLLIKSWFRMSNYASLLKNRRF